MSRSPSVAVAALILAWSLACSGDLTVEPPPTAPPPATAPAPAGQPTSLEVCQAAPKACDDGVATTGCELTCCWATSEGSGPGFPTLPGVHTVGERPYYFEAPLDPALCALDEAIPLGTRDLVGHAMGEPLVIPRLDVAVGDGMYVFRDFVVYQGQDADLVTVTWTSALEAAGFTTDDPDGYSQQDLEGPEIAPGRHYVYRLGERSVDFAVNGACGERRYPNATLTCVYAEVSGGG